MEEIREVNQRLIDTVVDISNEEVDPTAAAAAAEGTEGTIVKCSYNAVALSPSLKSQYASAQMVGFKTLKPYAYQVFINSFCHKTLSLFVFYCNAVTNSTLAIACSYKLS